MNEALSRSDELRAGLNTLRLETSEGQVLALLSYADLLLRWNSTYNLTAIRDPQSVLTHHLLDCLAPLSFLPQDGAGMSVLDVGSGGGLPGAVWAIMRPHWQITCVDSVAKKMAFVSQAAAQLALPNLRAMHTRLSNTKPAIGLGLSAYDLVTSRAFASLADFVALTKFHVKQSCHPSLQAPWLAMKGKYPEAELAALSSVVQLVSSQELLVPGLLEARCLVWLRPASAL